MKKAWIPTLMIALAAMQPAAAQRPAGYPRSYDDLVAAARAEKALRIYANADASELAPLIAAFRRAYPGIAVQYSDLGSTEIYRRFTTETRARRPSADLLWSSAMDLQIKLINDGYAQAYASPEKPAIPAAAVWKNMGYGVTAEPIGFVYNKRLVPSADVPRSHAALENLLRRKREAFSGRVITFDPARSNTGYLYLTQDYGITRDTGALLSAIAATRPVLVTSTGTMLDAVAQGKQAIAYNIIGSYGLERARHDPRIGVILPSDYTLITSRIAFIARDAAHPASAKLFLDFLLSRPGQRLLGQHSLWPVRLDSATRRLPAAQARVIRVGPQLLVNLDRIKRQRFLRDWNATLASGASSK